MKKMFLLAFVAIIASSCSKKEDPIDETKVDFYPLTIKYVPAYVGASESLYTFEYDANNRLSSFRIKDYRDSLYNKIV